MVQSHEKTLDGFTFHVNQMPALPALRMKARILALIGPALAPLFLLPKGKLLEKDISAFGPVLEALAGRLEPDAFASICQELFRGVAVVGEGKKFEPETEHGFNSLFTGRLPLMYKALYHVLEVNDFFGLGAIGKALGTAPVATPSSVPSVPKAASTKG